MIDRGSPCARTISVPFPYWELLDRHVQRRTVGFAGWRDIPDDADNSQGVLT